MITSSLAQQLLLPELVVLAAEQQVSAEELPELVSELAAAADIHTAAEAGKD